MINGKSNQKYWATLVEPLDSSRERTLASIIAQLREDGLDTAADDYQLRLRVLEVHNDAIRLIGSWEVGCPPENAQWIVGSLIYHGWAPPKGLMLTDEGKRVLNKKRKENSACLDS